MCWDFSKKLLKYIFGVLGTSWTKKIKKKKFQFFSFFIGGTLTILFSKKSPWEFEKNHKGPPYENEKNLKFLFLIFFCPRWSLGPPKIYLRSFFEKSQHKFESLLFPSGEFWNLHPLFQGMHAARLRCNNF